MRSSTPPASTQQEPRVHYRDDSVNNRKFASCQASHARAQFSQKQDDCKGAHSKIPAMRVGRFHTLRLVAADKHAMGLESEDSDFFPRRQLPLTTNFQYRPFQAHFPAAPAGARYPFGGSVSHSRSGSGPSAGCRCARRKVGDERMAFADPAETAHERRQRHVEEAPEIAGKEREQRHHAGQK